LIYRALICKPKAKSGISRSAWKGLAWGTVLSGIMWLAIISVILWIMGCTHKPLPPVGVYEFSGRLRITEGKDSWPASKNMQARAGLASSAGDIWISRELFSNPELVQRVLGHELFHLLHWKNPEVPNPDHE
jgi:hypothetical protein